MLILPMDQIYLDDTKPAVAIVFSVSQNPVVQSQRDLNLVDMGRRLREGTLFLAEAEHSPIDPVPQNSDDSVLGRVKEHIVCSLQ